MKSPIALKTLDILSTLKGGQGRIGMDRGGWQLKRRNQLTRDELFGLVNTC
jgi:hypothetical protein